MLVMSAIVGNEQTVDERRKNFLTEAEIEKFLRSSRKGPHGGRNFALMLLAYRRGLSAELSSYYNGALPGGCVENPLSQTQRFRRRFHIFVDVDVFNRAFQTHA
jgi:hypothetical protein